ncbi:AraC family transcriptional regulator [Actinomadura macrotermitis]|uniref:IS5 family transposase IS4811 n=1 Tax=Actinomadura macrotermitis TaxID=2585200 RepID=A0A7K0BR71_9ACTN|nr:AraC family transcriptional regulator [Actinomadura macrotermitis]MQY03695.1 IS5 family transposase IS4811 [Actinomadura macrotermitis]
MDPLTDVLALAQVRGTVAATVHAGDGWGLDIADIPGAAFHVITAGTAWLHLDGHDSRRLMPGDLVLLPAGSRHRLAAAPGLPCEPFDHVAARQAMAAGGRITVGAGPARTRILCASYRHDTMLATPPFGLLPPLLHLPPDPDRPTEHLVRLLAHEIEAPRAGADTALDRLLDVLLIHIFRAWAETAEPSASWLTALRDPVIAAALSALHADPARPWSLDVLARHVAVSRATLARRFPALVGETPLAYLTRWRMELAARRLRTTAEPIGPIARSVGYTSEYAFNRAFTRVCGTTPGRYRARHAPPGDDHPPGE